MIFCLIACAPKLRVICQEFFFSFCIVVLNDYCCHKCTHCYKKSLFRPKSKNQNSSHHFWYQKSNSFRFSKHGQNYKSQYFSDKKVIFGKVCILERSVTFHMNYILRLCMNFCSGKKKSRKKNIRFTLTFFMLFLKGEDFYIPALLI